MRPWGWMSQIAALEKELGDAVGGYIGGDSVILGDDIDVGDVEKSDAVAVGCGARVTKIRAHIVNVYREAPGRSWTRPGPTSGAGWRRSRSSSRAPRRSTSCNWWPRCKRKGTWWP